MVSERSQAKGRIKAQGSSDPELEEALDDAKGLADRENTNRIHALERSDKLHGHVHQLYVSCVYIVGACIIVCIVILIFHYAAPNNWRFLSPDEVSQLQNVLFSGTVGSGLTSAAKKVFN